MGAVMRAVKFGLGGIVGFAAAAVASLLAAPHSGEETRKRIEDRVKAAQLAGVEAQAAKESELIGRFRSEVGDADALRDEERRVTIERAQAVEAIGLGLNAPGALAAHSSLSASNNPVLVPPPATDARKGA